MTEFTRKEFLKATLAAGGAALLTRSRTAAAETAPAVARPGTVNGDVRVACVGINQQGHSHMRTYFDMPGARLVALCDADADVLAKRVQEADRAGIKVTPYRDYRKLLEDPGIDAVVIAMPNHWHSLATVWACQAGKDVYVEKPLSHNVWEGRQAVAATRQYNRIVQAGTQSRSSQDIKEAIADVRAGRYGRIKWARGLCYKMRESIGRTSGPQPVPASIDYDLWSGPAALVPPRRNSSHYGSVHYDWHWFWNYGGGDIANQGIHQMDVARWFLGESGLPPTVMSFGGRFGPADDAETPNTEVCVYGYEKAPLIFEVRGMPMKTGMRAMDAYRGTRVGVVVQCEDAYLTVSAAGAVVAFDRQDKKIRTYAKGGAETHRKNFIDAVRSRRTDQLNGPVEECHVSSALCHLGNISYRLGADKASAEIAAAVEADPLTKETFGRMLDHLGANGVAPATTPIVTGPALQCAAGTETFVSHQKYDLGFWGNTLLRRDYRAPFVVPEIAPAKPAGFGDPALHQPT